MRKIAAILPFLLLAAAAPPLDPETKKDVRCFLALSMLNENEDEGIRQAGLLGSQYYLGRIDGRVPGLDLEAALEAEAGSIDEAAHTALLESCGKLMETRGSEVVAIGEALERRGL
jgi:hypothetical protein